MSTNIRNGAVVLMPINLLVNGGSCFSVVIPHKHPPAVRYAAEEFIKYFKELSKVELNLIDNGTVCHENVIMIGHEVSDDRLAGCGNEGFIIQTISDNVLIVGKTPRGTLYGVYTFFEDYLGIRFFTPDITRVPKRSNITIDSGIDRLEKPVFEYREPCFREVFDGDWAARLKTNGNFPSLTEKHGGKIKYGMFGHSFQALCSPEIYFDAHPEYFSEIDGIRLHDDTQLCLSNPEVLKIVINNLLEHIKNNPDVSIVSVSQNDNENYCRCENCNKVDEEEESQSGSIIHFVNAVAEAVEQEYPSIAIDTFAYTYSRKAPKYVKPLPNVIVRLCNIERCFLHPVTERCPDWPKTRPGEENRTFTDELIKWGKLTNRIYIWDYYVNFIHYPLPHPILHVFKQNLVFYKNNGVKGVFEQGSLCSNNSYFAELKAYLLSRLLWNPDIDDKAVIDEFFAGVYGMAAPVMKRIYDEFYADVLKDDFHLYFTMHAETMFKSLNLDSLKKYEDMFANARLLADDEATLFQVKKAEMWLRYLMIYKTPMGSPCRNDMIDQYIEDCGLYDMIAFEEQFTLQESKRWLKQSMDPERHNYGDPDNSSLYEFPGFID